MSPRGRSRALAGRVAAITGGARGIGAATAAAFAREGMAVAIGDVDEALARRTADELAGRGARVRAYALDVTDPASVEAFVAGAEADLGPLDVFDANAGIMPLGAFLDETPESTARQLAVNVEGVVNGVRAVLPRFADRRAGHLVTVASMAGRSGFPGAATYCGTKHFVVGFSEAIRAELRWAGIPVDVSCVMPAVVQTELAAGLRPTRGVTPATAEDVAAAIVAALRRPRFDVPVPAVAGPIAGISGALPRRGQDLIGRLIGADETLIGADPAARAAYERRAAGGA
ncbi:SDR family NAD(P)-dependent oxidoreductase [Patulibacter sp. SYSU D01012]|uniref:SDR family NAD(P)-dependent oxidoreductase n=1 Tax=Patulibacter sp. SYSU D01012 TaxID=2817381 RepID=UPI001B30A55E|nr:SDR family NAD(P)-dependent oxidoreductase [Patulibacter sp. SYSU D01012]